MQSDNWTQKAKDMENKLHDAEFKKTEEYADFEKKYIKIILLTPVVIPIKCVSFAKNLTK